MANCKICGHPVVAGPVLHSECLTKMVTEAVETFCDSYCRWPLENGELLESYCSTCPMDKLIKLVRRQ